METTGKNTIKIAGRDTNIEAVTAEWLTSRARNGRQRVECLGWKRLAAIYAANKHNSPICAIREAAPPAQPALRTPHVSTSSHGLLPTRAAQELAAHRVRRPQGSVKRGCSVARLRQSVVCRARRTAGGRV